MPDAPSLAPKARKLLERFRRQRAKADQMLDELDATAHQLASTLGADGWTLRESAPLVSREDRPISHAQVAAMRDGQSSPKPWMGNRRQGDTRG